MYPCMVNLHFLLPPASTTSTLLLPLNCDHDDQLSKTDGLERTYLVKKRTLEMVPEVGGWMGMRADWVYGIGVFDSWVCGAGGCVRMCTCTCIVVECAFVWSAQIPAHSNALVPLRPTRT